MRPNGFIQLITCLGILSAFTYSGDTLGNPLSVALFPGRCNIAELTIKAGADKTAFFLIEHGADPNHSRRDKT